MTSVLFTLGRYFALRTLALLPPPSVAGGWPACLGAFALVGLLATLTCIGFAADTVHRDRQGFMGFWAKGAKRNPRRYQPFTDAGN